ncbi:DegT/DnrJ/EryC1/StrS family aminotransferase [Vogesella indigofera]|uniref:DegT/DnrJ/EryC1/StrS family aminotransferase n=1 Tax=Vogesella indigofera TaxID=45465 RepID=A0ABT5I8T0_VOGIN|nr:DegT/DnrJ/EryC1/StrS family aminotransferase [Vogesella indigofera]MDC7691856.1 DegT/DnrJ/EryC1/StrS family aminotransferase [Vogesella indigofera]
MLTANSLSIWQYLSAFPAMLAGRRHHRAALRIELAQLFEVEVGRIVLFDSGRAAFGALLRLHGVQAGDEVIVPAFTCVVVPNQVPPTGATLRFVDVGRDSLNFDWLALDAAITPHTRVVVVPHNFGIACEVPTWLREKQRHVRFVDDAAHGFASRCDGQWLGTYHDGAFFSFEYSKNLTGGIGGMALLPAGSELPPAVLPELPCGDEWRLAATLKAHLLSARWPLLGRCTMAAVRRLGMVYRSGDGEVARGEPHPPRAMPLLSAVLLRRQLPTLAASIAHKQQLATRYQRALATLPDVQQWPAPQGTHWVRYPFALPFAVTDKAALARQLSAASGLNIGVWFDDVIHPAGAFRHGYVAGSAPHGERLAASVLNLPMNIALPADAQLERKLARLSRALAELLRQHKDPA